MADPYEGAEITVAVAQSHETPRKAGKAEQLHDTYGWVWKIAVIAVLVVITVAGLVKSGIVGIFGGSEVALAAVIVGVSIAFTGVLVPCVFLIISRSGGVRQMREDAADIEGHVERGRLHATLIQQHRVMSKVRET
jgi:hypothetical protein